mgnify:CR=1 FL=1
MIYIFVIGLIFGSFFNVVGLRVPKKQSIIAPRSACPACNHQLTAVELIPVFSYVLQQGKCRNCRKQISPLYPFIELLTAILFAISPFLVGWSKELIISWTLVSLLMIIFVSDVKYMIIPDKVLLFFAVIFMMERVIVPLTPWWDSFQGAVIGFSLLFLIAFVSKGGMGGGDIKLFAVIGLALGVKMVLLSFFLATLFGAFFGFLVIAVGKAKRREPVAFGPYIVLGTLIAYFFGEVIFSWYISIWFGS